MSRPRFDCEGDPRPCLVDRMLERAALIHWKQCTFAGLIGFELCLLIVGAT